MAESTTARPTPAHGVFPLDDRQAKLQRRTVLVLTIVPFAGFVGAIATLWGWGVGAVDLGIMLTMYALTGLGVTVGFHRYFAHRSFDAAAPVRVVLAVAGSLAVQGSIIAWVATHRRHHAYSDKDGDPHSPHLDEGEGIGGVLTGLWHAHIGWMLSDQQTSAERWAPDLLKDPSMRRIDRYFPVLIVSSFTLPALLGWAISGTWQAALTAFLWGGPARMFFLHHVTWSINSICHFYGSRPFETTDYSTNNWPLALVSFGESWHNNHHAFPAAAVHGIRRWQLDLSGLLIAALERGGLARNVKRVTRKQLAAKAR